MMRSTSLFWLHPQEIKVESRESHKKLLVKCHTQFALLLRFEGLVHDPLKCFHILFKFVLALSSTSIKIIVLFFFFLEGLPYPIIGTLSH